MPGLLVLSILIVFGGAFYVAFRLGVLDQNVDGNSTKVQFCIRDAPQDAWSRPECSANVSVNRWMSLSEHRPHSYTSTSGVDVVRSKDGASRIGERGLRS
jgi:hypothetical protein